MSQEEEAGLLERIGNKDTLEVTTAFRECHEVAENVTRLSNKR